VATLEGFSARDRVGGRDRASILRAKEGPPQLTKEINFCVAFYPLRVALSFAISAFQRREALRGFDEPTPPGVTMTESHTSSLRIAWELPERSNIPGKEVFAVLQRGAASSSALEQNTHAQTAIQAPGIDTFGDGWNTMNTSVQTKQGPVEYRIVGHGPVILVLNGGHTTCHSPLGHEQFFLEQGYQLLIPSRPGYGKTPSSVGRTAEAFADALVSMLDLLHFEQVIVVGISAGGRTALQLAGRHPERVSKVILQNAVTGGRFPTGLTRLLAYLLFNPVVERWTWASFRAFARIAPQAALKRMMSNLSTLEPDQVLATMSQDQQQAALAFLLASRSGAGFLHDMHHRTPRHMILDMVGQSSWAKTQC
jgi:pimeloyl-ACP methyl ester carboxylesterase